MAMRKGTEQVRAKVVAAAGHLFKTRGYRDTTIRLIVAESGVLIGSIYHLFKNKEEIFLAVADEKLENCVRLIYLTFPRESEFFRFLCLYDINMHMLLNNEISRENYYATYSSPLIAEHLSYQIASVSKRIFAKSFPDLSLEDFRIRNILLQGAFRNFIMGLYFKKPIEVDAAGMVLLKLVFNIFDIRKEKANDIIEELTSNREKILQIVQQIIAEDLKI